MFTCAAIQWREWLEAAGVFWLQWEWRLAAVLAVSGIAAFACRRQSGALRHALWTGGAVAALLVPLLMVSLPEWRIMPVPAVGTPSPRPSPEPPAVVSSTVEADQSDLAEAVLMPAAISPQDEPAAPAVQAQPVSPVTWPGWKALAATVIGIGSLLCLGRIAAGQIALLWTVRRAYPATDERILTAFRQCAAKLRMRGLPSLHIGAPGVMPMAWSLFHRRGILLPAEAADWPAQRLSAVLLHELAHVRRRDCLTQLIAELLVALHWFNPLAYVTRARMRRERETACDDMVLAAGQSNCDYAEHLMAVAAAMHRSRLAAGVAMARPGSIESRVRSILDTTLPRRAPGRAALVALAMLCLAVIVPLTSLRARAAADQGTPAPQERTVSLLVLDKASGRPIPNARIRFDINAKPGEARADAKGRCNIALGTGLDTFAVVSRPRGFVPKGYVWWRPLATKPPIPPELVFHHDPATSLGGIVRDELGRPVADVTVTLSMSSGNVAPTEEHVAIHGETARTDSAGRWDANVFPENVGDLDISLSHPRFLDLMVRASSSPTVSIERLRAGDAVLVMRPGVRITGRVVNERGDPLPGARVGFGADASDEGVQTTAVADASGDFVLLNARPEPGKLVVDADGHVVHSRQLTPAAGGPPVEIKLKPGQRITLRVTDPDGKPLPKAQVMPQAPLATKPRPSGPEFHHVDATGRYVYDQAGDDPVAFNIYHEDFFFVSKASFAAGKEHQVVMKPGLVVQGAVVDEATGQSIPRGTVSFVQMYSDGSGGASPYDLVSFEGGRYRVTMTDTSERFGVRVSADGYLPADSPLVEFPSAPAVSTFDLKLKKHTQAPVRLVRPDGQPAAGASVVLCEAGSSIFMSARNPDMNGQNPVLKADARGEVRFTPPPQEQWLLSISHETGWALVAPAPLAKDPSIRLIPWGTLHGTVFENGKPVEGVVVGIGSLPSGSGMDDIEPHWMDETTSDRRGRFEFAKVPCRPLSIGRKVSFHGSSLSTSETMVLVEPGKTLDVVVGDKGRAVTGRIVLEDADGAYVDSHIRLWIPRVDAPRGLAGLSDMDAARKFWLSPEYQRYMAASRYYAASLAPDGSFSFASVVPGNYELASQPRKEGLRRYAFREHKQQVEVSSSGDESQAKPLDLGTIRYRLVLADDRQQR